MTPEQRSMIVKEERAGLGCTYNSRTVAGELDLEDRKPELAALVIACSIVPELRAVSIIEENPSILVDT